MSFLTIILLAIGLAMDCFAVSVCKGLAAGAHKRNMNHAFAMPIVMAVLFGVFQGGMPLIGYFAGTLFASFFERFAPWIALALLGFIGGKMIYESIHEDTCDAHSADFSLKLLVSLAIATSIDALATGVVFIPHPKVIWMAVGVIALVSFLFSMGGYLMGVFAGKRLHFNIELLGGVILILIGLEIFIKGICF